MSFPKKAILFAGLLYNRSVSIPFLYERLESSFGPILFNSKEFAFTFSDYYEREMGKELTRIYVGFDLLIDMEEIADIKLKTNELEKDRFSPRDTCRAFHDRRDVNIDPGYLTNAKVVLATTKDHQHRIYMKNGIYAEVTLRYRKNRYEPWEWTYRDYRTEEAIEFFHKLRAFYRRQIQSLGV